MKRAAAVIVAILAITLVLTGCQKTITVTYKYRSLVGLYWVCDGPSFAPCVKGDIYRVSKSDYDRARIGYPLTITIL